MPILMPRAKVVLMIPGVLQMQVIAGLVVVFEYRIVVESL